MLNVYNKLNIKIVIRGFNITIKLIWYRLYKDFCDAVISLLDGAKFELVFGVVFFLFIESN